MCACAQNIVRALLPQLSACGILYPSMHFPAALTSYTSSMCVNFVSTVFFDISVKCIVYIKYGSPCFLVSSVLCPLLSYMYTKCFWFGYCLPTNYGNLWKVFTFDYLTTFRVSVFPLVSYMNTHLPTVPSCGTFYTGNRSWNSLPPLPGFRHISTLVAKTCMSFMGWSGFCGFTKSEMLL